MEDHQTILQTIDTYMYIHEVPGHLNNRPKCLVVYDSTSEQSYYKHSPGGAIPGRIGLGIPGIIMGGAIPGITGGVNTAPIMPSTRGFLADGSPSLEGLAVPGGREEGRGEHTGRETQSRMEGGAVGHNVPLEHQPNMYVYVYVT